MGNGALLPLKWSFQDEIDLTLISKMMPAYYVQDNVPTPTEIADAIAQWNMVYNEEVKSGNSKRRNDSNKEWFETVFYERLYDIHPLARHMQLHETSFLADLIELIFQQQRSRDQFTAAIRNFVENPQYLNFKSIEYVIVGDVLLHAIGVVMGKYAFTEDVLLLWRKMYSVVLRYLIPQTIQKERRRDMNNPSYGTVFTDDSSTAHVGQCLSEYSLPALSSKRVPALSLDSPSRLSDATPHAQTNVSNECFNIAESGPSKMIYCREATIDDVMDYSEIP